MKPVIAIVGAGAIGCYYGGRLAQHGQDVHFLFRSGYDSVAKNGLIVGSPDGDFSIAPDQLHIHRSAADVPKADIVIVTLKTTANDQFEALIGPLVKESSLILTLQNGLGNEERLAELFGAERVLGGLAFVCVNRMPDGTIRHMDHGQIKLGEFAGGPRERTRELARMFSESRVDCRVLDDLRFGRWEKLVWNVPFNGLGALLGKTTDKLIGSKAGVEMVTRLMREVMAAAGGLGVKLPPDLPELKIAHTRTMGAYRTSMQIDREEGRPLEVESILGRPLSAARGAGVATPYMQTLYDLLCLG